MTSEFVRCEIYDGPDRNGDYHFALFWMADYTPGHPDGEHVRRERGQHFRANAADLPAGITIIDKRGKR
jgi:hypothetical protein